MVMTGKRKRNKKSNEENNEAKVPRKTTRGASFSLPVPQRPTDEGHVLVCGQGDMGQLGLGPDLVMYQRKFPTLVKGIPTAVDVCAGGMHSLILTSSGQVYSFGCNDEGALGRETTDANSEYTPMLVNLPGKAVCLSAGDSHSACILEDGSVFAWGTFRDSNGNMGLNIDGNQRLPVNILPAQKCVQIASGVDHLVMLSRTGHVYTVGRAEQGQLGRVPQRTALGASRRGNVTSLKPSETFTHPLNRFTEIWATNFGTFMREHKTKKIYACGLNNYGQLTLLDKPKTVYVPVCTELGADVLQIAGGEHHTLVLKETRAVQVIGNSHYGRLGLGDVQENVTALRNIDQLEDKQIAATACGMAQSFAINENGVLFAWGMGSNLQLGTGKEDDVLEPMQVQSKQTMDKRVLRVSSGGQHTIFLVALEPSATESVNANDTANASAAAILSENVQPAAESPPQSEDQVMKEAETTVEPETGAETVGEPENP